MSVKKEFYERAQVEGIANLPFCYPQSYREGYICHAVKTGGMDGGNCWGDEAEEFNCDISSADYEFHELYNILKEFAPDIRFLDIKELEHSYLKSDRFEILEYYGNCDDYDIKYIKIDDLWNFLEEKGYVS